MSQKPDTGNFKSDTIGAIPEKMKRRKAIVKRRSDLVATQTDWGEIEIHAPSAGSEYDTFCGIAGEDDSIGINMIPLPRNARINCDQCALLWYRAKSIRSSDFHPSILRRA